MSRAILSLVEKLNAVVLVGSKGTNWGGGGIQGDGAVCVFCHGVRHRVWETALGQGGGKGD